LSLIPAFELGVLNAWILVIPILIIFLFDVRATAARESGRAGDFKLTRRENRISNAFFIPMVVSWLYAIFLPLQSNTIWLYGGLAIYLFGIVFAIEAVHTFATSPKDKLITTGPYHFTRNPMVLGMFLLFIGLGIAYASWLFLLLTGILIIMFNALSPAEERFCLYLYGDDYREYMNRTPRWIGIPKSGKK
jgi:protein-S-isoprenylcysteine O-methyltransferase Ste14